MLLNPGKTARQRGIKPLLDLKIILYDKKFWDQVINIPKLAELGTISEKDLKLFEYCSSVDEMEQVLLPHLKKVEKKSRLLR